MAAFMDMRTLPMKLLVPAPLRPQTWPCVMSRAALLSTETVSIVFASVVSRERTAPLMTPRPRVVSSTLTRVSAFLFASDMFETAPLLIAPLVKLSLENDMTRIAPVLAAVPETPSKAPPAIAPWEFGAVLLVDC